MVLPAAESQANALLEQTRNVSALNSSQVDQLVSELENLLSGPNVSVALGNTSVHIVSNLLGAPAETLADSSNRLHIHVLSGSQPFLYWMFGYTLPYWEGLE